MSWKGARPGADRVPAAGRAVLPVSLVPGFSGLAGLEDGSECGALRLSEGWGLGDEVLNAGGQGVGDRRWWRGRWGCAVVLTCCGAGVWRGYGRVVGTSPPHDQGLVRARRSNEAAVGEVMALRQRSGRARV